jgi:hypothetical protein
VGLFGLLTAVFVALKLMHYIDWSWVMVVSLVWLPAVLWCGVALLVTIGGGIAKVARGY